MYNSDEILHLDFESSSLCNALCPVCNRREQGGRKNPRYKETYVTLEQYKKYFNKKFLAQLYGMSLCGNYGDAMTNPELIPILRYTKEINPNIRITMNSNASGRNPKFWQELGEIIGTNGHMTFSVDGLEDTNWIYRRGTHWPKIMSAMKNYIKGGGHARWEFLVFKHNQHQVEEAKQLAKDIGIHEFFSKKALGFVDSVVEGKAQPALAVFNESGLKDYEIHPPSDGNSNKVINDYIAKSSFKKVEGDDTDNPEKILQTIHFTKSKTSKESYTHKYDWDKTRPLSKHEIKLGKTKIDCMVIKPKSIFVSSEGLVFPCCMTASKLYAFPDEETTQLREFIDSFGKDKISLEHTSLEDIIDGPMFQKHWPDNWKDTNINNKRLRTCSIFCGKETNKEFDATMKSIKSKNKKMRRMYYNKWTIERSERIQTIHAEPQHYDMYQNFLDELHPDVRHDKYYFISPLIACEHFDEDEFDGYDYLTLTDKLIDKTIADKKITKELEDGEACIIFDMGAEFIPISYYEKVNKFYSQKKNSQNVKYWTMFENEQVKGDIEFLTISTSTLRFADYEENKIKNVYDDKWEFDYSKIHKRHLLFLNKRIRPHRLDILAKLIENHTSLKENAYYSFLGTDNTGEGDPLFESDIKAIRGGSYDSDMANTIITEYYKDELPYSMNHSRDEWLSGSSLNRIEEMMPYRKRSYVELITEFTHSDEHVSISEKLSQAILSKKPFIIVGDKGYLANLRRLGFKTFDGFWDEGYDELPYNERIDAIAKVVKRIVDYTELQRDGTEWEYDKVLQQMLEFNYNHYKNVYAPTVYKHAFQSMSKGDYKPQLESAKFEDLEDNQLRTYVWYSENTNTIILPILGMLDKVIAEKIAPHLGYRLVKRKEIDNIEKIHTIAFTRHPYKRFASYLANSHEVLGEDFNEPKDKVELEEQSALQHGLHISYTIDLDDLHNTGYYARCVDWHLPHRHRDLARRIVEILQTVDIETPDELTKEQKEWVDEHYAWDFVAYNEWGSWRFRKPYSIDRIGFRFEQYFDNFKDVYKKEFKSLSKKLVYHQNYLKSSLESAYWVNHSMMLDNLGLNYAPKDIKILDIGTHFGFMPHFLESEGFTNVHSTNSYKEAGDSLEELKLIWKTLGIRTPADVHIQPQKDFDLLNNMEQTYGKDFDPKEKYDIILMNMSNVFWKTDKIVRLVNGNISQSWQITDENKDRNTFFAPFETSDIQHFIDCIKRHLKVGGAALIQPFPYAYTTFEGFKGEQDAIAHWQNPHRGHQTPMSTLHCPTPEMNDYFIITKDN